MKHIKKILSILFGVFFYLFIYSLLQVNQNTNNDFTELNNIELYIKISEGRDEFTENLIEKLKQCDYFVSDVYLDESRKIFLNNALKNKSLEEIDVYTGLFKTPSINNLFYYILKLSENYNLKLNHDVVDVFINTLFNTCLNDLLNKNFHETFIQSLLMNNLDYDNEKEYKKIIIASNKQFVDGYDKKESYLELFDYIDSIDKKNNIKFIVFNNNLSFNTFVEYKTANGLTYEPVFEPIEIFYEDSIEEIKDLQYQINQYVDTESSVSILNYLTSNNLTSDKFKKIKNLSIYTSAYTKVNDLSYFDYNDLLNSLIDLESNISNVEKSNNEITYKVNFIYQYFKINEKNFKLNKLINNYNMNCPEYIGNVANTEIVNLDFLDPVILNDYYNKDLKKYVLKVKIDKSNYLFYKKFILNKNSSLIYNFKFLLLNVIFVLTATVSLAVSFMMRKK